MCCKWRQNNSLLFLDTPQGYPIATYPFILVLEVAFLFIKANISVERLTILNHNFFYPAYTDNTTENV